MPEELNRSLVVVRCGDRSLHPEWCVGAHRFDIAISYFGNDESKTFPEAIRVHRLKAGKWDGLANFFRENADLINQYNQFWFPDDDIATDAHTIDNMFDLFRQHKLDLGQPSLTSDSYFSHPMTLQNPSFDLRYMSFIEIMVPVMSNSFLKQALETFNRTRTGFGLDYVWASMVEDPRRIAILDKVAVKHTRPVGGDLHKNRPDGSLDAIAELRREVMARGITGHCRVGGIPVPCAFPRLAVTNKGKEVGRISATVLQAQGLLYLKKQTVQTLSFRRIFNQVVKGILG